MKTHKAAMPATKDMRGSGSAGLQHEPPRGVATEGSLGA